MKHGHAVGYRVTTEYYSWAGMLARCQNPKSEYFSDYGGRGIVVCERWQKFENFISDMGLKPGPRFTLERIDNDKGYNPPNCRWDTRTAQARNRRVNRNSRSGLRGVTWYKKSGKWRAVISVAHKMIHLGYFETTAEAFSARLEGERTYWGVAA